MQQMKPSGYSTKEIIAATDKCVMCGLCLPHCPTYLVARNEAESPRGRIAIVRALHEHTLHPDPALVNHLDQCLTCMNCAAVCPVQVDYGKILDAGRDATKYQHTFLHRLKQSLILATLSKIRVRGFAKSLLRMYHGLKADFLLRKLYTRFPYAIRILALIPRPHETGLIRSPLPVQAPKSRVILVHSCAADLFSDPAIVAAEVILQALHCETVRLPQTRCCGALHQHSGNTRAAGKTIREFCEAFRNQEFDAVVSLGTGCAAQIRQYPELLDEPLATTVANHHVEINAFVTRLLETHSLCFKPLPQKVLVHRPCTQKQVSNDLVMVENLLGVIPDIRLEAFQDDAICCGAGGMNIFTQPRLADRLVQTKIAELKSSQAVYLVTSNIGCALHFQTQLSKINAPVRVCHPIQLLAQQLLYSEHA